MTTILKGNIISAPSPGRLDVTENGYLIAENGVITGVYPVLPEQYAGAAVEDCGDALIVQSFADLHLHGAPVSHAGHGDGPALCWIGSTPTPFPRRPALPTRTTPGRYTASWRRSWLPTAPRGCVCSPPSTPTPR